MRQMAVGSDHTPFQADSGAVDRLCQQMQISGIDPELTFTREGGLASGVALLVDATTSLTVGGAADLFAQQAYDILAAGLPLSVTALRMGAGQEAATRFGTLCDLLRLAMERAAADPAQIGIVYETGSLAPQQAWLCRSSRLGEGPLYLLPDKSLPQQDRHERFWPQLWNLRTANTVRFACAPVVVSPCRLLSAEVASAILPGVALQIPPGTAWLPLRLDISRFVDNRGELRREQFEQALRQSVELGDELHRLVAWPTAQARHDAWLNRRLAITITGLGDLLQRQGFDPGCFEALQSLCKAMHAAMNILHWQSRQVALRRDRLPALLQTDPSREMPRGVARNSWHQRWSRAADAAATGHRNLLVLPLWSVFPQNGPADFRYTDLLPVLGIANACAISAAPDLSHWTVSQFRRFHERAWAVLQQRDAAHQIAERI